MLSLIFIIVLGGLTGMLACLWEYARASRSDALSPTAARAADLRARRVSGVYIRDQRQLVSSGSTEAE